MLIDAEKCIGCGNCVAYCPVEAISLSKRPEPQSAKGKDRLAVIDLEECAECGVCLRSAKCPTDAIYQQPLVYPRTVRSLMSDVLTIAEESQISGRGTEEMKTNEVTGRFKPGIVGVAIEVGRPITGTRMVDVEKIAMAVCALNVDFESCNPVTSMMTDPRRGKFRDDLLNEKVLSAILEFAVKAGTAARIVFNLEKSGKGDRFGLQSRSCLPAGCGRLQSHAALYRRRRTLGRAEWENQCRSGTAATRGGLTEMTHTLHRLGTDESILKQDFVMLAMPSKDINHVGSAPKLRRFFEIALEAGAIKIGDCRSGNEYYQGGVDKILENVEDPCRHPRRFQGQRRGYCRVEAVEKKKIWECRSWFPDFSVRSTRSANAPT